MKNSGSGELEAFFPLRPECQADVPKTRFKPRVGTSLNSLLVIFANSLLSI